MPSCDKCGRFRKIVTKVFQESLCEDCAEKIYGPDEVLDELRRINIKADKNENIARK